MPRTKEQNKEIRDKTKKLILDSALKLFAEKGFQTTSMSDIAELAGVSKGLAYNYFDSKQHLVEEIFKNFMSVFAELYLPAQEEQDPYIRLEKYTDITFRWLKDGFDFWRMIFALWLQPGVFERSTEFMTDFFSEVFTEIEKIFKEIGMPDYIAESRIYGALLDGISMEYILDKDNYPIDIVVASMKSKYSREVLENSK